MGMDVYGVAPASNKGEYFRNNVWWWRPLWDYCCEVSDLARNVEGGHSNSGDGLDGEGAKALAITLLDEIATGRTQAYKEARDKELAELPLENCHVCDGTGKRENNSCKGCGGIGKRANWATNYPFSVENVREFAEFLIDCGGFEIC